MSYDCVHGKTINGMRLIILLTVSPFVKVSVMINVMSIKSNISKWSHHYSSIRNLTGGLSASVS